MANLNLVSNKFDPTLEKYDFVARLNKELLKRMENNDRYSMRAFARDLSMDPSNLSKILRRKNEVGLGQIEYLAKQLDFQKEEIDRYVEFRSSNGTLYRPYLKKDGNQLFHWVYLAILELMNTDGFRSEEKWIAKQLGISEEKASECLNYLVDGEYIAIDQSGNYYTTEGYNNFLSGKFNTAETKKKLYASYIDLSKEALDKLPNDRNVFTTMTLSFNRKNYLKAKDYLRKISLEFDEKFNDKSESAEIYNLNLNLFPVKTTTHEGD